MGFDMMDNPIVLRAAFLSWWFANTCQNYGPNLFNFNYFLSKFILYLLAKIFEIVDAPTYLTDSEYFG